MHLRTIFLAISCCFLAACQQQNDSPAETETVAETLHEETQDTQAKASQALHALFDEWFEANLELNPLFATQVGDTRYNHIWPNNISEEYRNKSRDLSQVSLDKLNAIDLDQLNAQDQLSYQIFRNDMEENLAGLDFPSWLIPINQFYNPTNLFAMFGSGTSSQPFRTADDYRNFIGRAEGFSEWVDQAISNMQEGVEQGVVQPKALMVKTLPQIEALIVEDPETSLFWNPIKNMPESISNEDALELQEAWRSMITDTVVPAYQRMHSFIQDHYLDASRDTSGMTGLPMGEAWYANLVASYTSTDLTPDEIHQIGLDEVARIQAAMHAVMAEVNFEGDLQDFFNFTRDDPQFVFPSREAMLEAYRSLQDSLEATAPDLFKLFPKAGFEVRPVEAFRERSASSGSYQSPSEDGTRPGIFYLNTYDLSARPIWAMEALFLHEAIPGHHFQLALQQELSELPRFRKFGGTTAFIEGWGLYSETLGKEMGAYTDPYQYFGALVAEMWRAIRLVVDTGLHAKGWSREEVLEYMQANAPVAEARRVSETERFMAIPGQALAYKIGQLKIRELRNRAEQALGDQFDIREFHAQVLSDGSLPLKVLEAKIDNWIASQQDS